MWDLPRSGIEPVSPALADGFFTAESPEKPFYYFLKLLSLSLAFFHGQNFHLYSEMKFLTLNVELELENTLSFHHVKLKLLSRVQLFVTSWTIAHQAPPSMKFSRQEYWNGLPFPSPGDLPDPGIKPRSPRCRQTLYPQSHEGRTSF